MRSILRSAVLGVALITIGASAFMAPPTQATSAPKTIQTPNWDGYATSSQAGNLTSVTATWDVPEVLGCPLKLGSTHGRVAVWAGLSGSTTFDIGKPSQDRAWLLQAGTDSRCFGYTKAVWEVFNNRGGVQEQFFSMDVHSGDQVQATVRYGGVLNDGTHVFYLSLTNLSNNKETKSASVGIDRNRNLNLADAAKYGTAMVEGMDAPGYGYQLANFKTFSISDFSVAPAQALSIYDVQMIGNNHQELVAKKPLSPDHWVVTFMHSSETSGV